LKIFGPIRVEVIRGMEKITFWHTLDVFSESSIFKIKWRGMQLAGHVAVF